MKKILYLFILIFSFSTKINAQVTKTKAPSWVEQISYSSETLIDESSIEQGVLTLLYQQSINETEKVVFFRNATKITENVGVQSGSSINILYDPSYQSLKIHSIIVHRNGKIIDKLKTSDFQLIRKELNSENYIYDGSLSAISNLSDIRVGDIIEYSYSIKGFNPIHKNNFSTSFYLNSTQPVGKMKIDVLTRKELDFKYLNTNLKFNKKKKGNSFQYTITEENIKPFEYDFNIPSWKFQPEIAFVSEYKSWEEVVNWGLEVFNVNKNLSKGLMKQIDEIKKNNTTSSDRISATLNFVQDEIRYLGLESGIGAYKPFSSNKVFKQRFGDCKDKSLLMVEMLNKMGIEAYPMLVNTYLKQTILDVLPSPVMFDHCVVKVVDKNEGDLWFDPTISNQGGVFNKTSFPDYQYGLVLKKGNAEFEEVYSLANNSMEVIDTYILEEVGKGATLDIETRYYDGQADFIRGYFQNNGTNTIKKEYENFYSKYFYNIKSLEPITFKDDAKKNEFITYESYKIDSLWQPSINKDQITTSFYPYTIINVLNMPTKRERKEPFALLYPSMRTHTINVELPQEWNILNDSYIIDSPSIFYDFDVRHNRNTNILSIKHILKNQKDHVSPEKFSEFYDNLKKIDSNIAYSLIIPKDYTGVSSTSNTNWLQYLGVLIFIIIFSISVWLATKLYSYNPKPKIESYFEENKPISGWLVIVGIGLCIYPFMILFGLLGEEAILVNGYWITFFDTDYSHYNIYLGIILFLEMAVNVFIFIATLLFIYLFFKKRSSFPKLYSYTLIGALLFIIFDTLLVSFLTDIEIQEAQTNEIVISFIKTGIIATYLLISDNVKETFVKTLK